MPHQLEALAFAQDNPRALCALGTGLGKTATATGLAAWMLDTDQLPAQANVPAVVYLTDAPLVEQTAAEVQRFCPHLAVSTTKESRWANTAPGPRVLAQFRERQGDRPLVVVGTYQWLRARIESTAASWAPALLVLDEVTAVSGGGPEQQAALALSGRSQRVLGLSATPWQSNPLQAFSVLESIGTPGLWPRGQFEREFVRWSQAYEVSPGRWVEPKPEDFASSAHHQAFTDYLHQVMHRVSAEETGQRLPELTRSVVWVRLHPAQQKAYENGSRIGGSTGHKKQEVAGRHHEDVSSLVEELVAQLTGPYAGRQAVVYCESLAVLPLAAAALAAVGISSTAIEGKVPQAEREHAVARFCAGQVQVLLGSSVLERGLNLQTANLLISLDSSWTDDRETQREGRIRRIGSEHEQAHHLVLLPETKLVQRKVAKVQLRAELARSVLAGR
ncbi:DEAD/DEAH box helicase [Kineococcus rhizosphaerae]|uniref:Superfamily II DNA or RNA helicase n=1 Tax=Kineococcus rhizosphaerae TaxID=559628 RepID=A0A2T0QLT3_9ACTN|nr:DEAD/DEAH box helicase [Kineococcus rhizosphaerae]PRY05315.1 superfamily II DNA or RNA helicase [Kineococcus rhizosphaerae]